MRAVLGVLAAAVLAVTLLVVTSNQINSKKSALADITQKTQTEGAAGSALAPYGQFAKLEQARTSTVQALAGSRFNWERVLRQLSRTVPPGVWITSLTGTVSTDTSGGSGSSGSGSSLRSQVPGPALVFQGCAGSQKGSAQMVTRMRNLDGVTSVTLTKSEHPDTEGGSSVASSSSGSGASTGCPSYQFDLLVGFKATGPAASAAGAQALPAGATGATGSTGPTGSTGSSGTTG
jgi:Tfp pilus assembly protein PilN